MSRHKDSPRTVGFTLVRILELPKPYKDDCYAYLYTEKVDGRYIVPSCEINGSFDIYTNQNETRLPTIEHGTMVRHYSYKLGQLSNKLQASPGNLYHFLHCSLFDPLLPFRIVDLREEKIKNEIVTGSRNRLMKLAYGKKQEGEEFGTGTEVKLYRPMEYIVPIGSDEPCIGIEYWIVYNYRKGTGAKKDDIVLRAHSNELYIQKGHPIIATYNGQNQGELTAKIFRDIGLNMVARHCIIHIDTTKVNNKVRRELFASHREGFKEGSVLEGLESVLMKILKEDDALIQLERELTERLINDESKKTRDEVKRNITRLLIEAGYAVRTEGLVDKRGNEEERTIVRERRPGPHVVVPPLMTLPFPEVTRFEIVKPKPKMTVRIGDNECVLVETDADAEYDHQNRIAIRWEPESALELAAKAPLRGGRIRWRLRPSQTTKVGEHGAIVVTLTKPNGIQLSDRIDFEVISPKENKSEESKGYAPPFEVIGIDPYSDPEKWNEVWDNIPDTEPHERLASVAYKPLKLEDKIFVYYSKIFESLHEQVEKIQKESSTFLDLFMSNYETWIGYHGILQKSSTDLEEGKEHFMEEERIRVAKMQIRQAFETTRLMIKHSIQSNVAIED